MLMELVLLAACRALMLGSGPNNRGAQGLSWRLAFGVRISRDLLGGYGCLWIVFLPCAVYIVVNPFDPFIRSPRGRGCVLGLRFVYCHATATSSLGPECGSGNLGK